jgi:hypothetical protein
MPVPGERIVSGNDARLVVMFDPRISHAEMQRLLRFESGAHRRWPERRQAPMYWRSRRTARRPPLDALRGEPGVALVQSLDRGEAGDKR